VPTVFGESVVLRILDRAGDTLELEQLGMPAPLLLAFRDLVQRPHGLLLVTGPTGSGKTTTMYAALRERDARREKIITVEDPVEYQLPGITQVPVHHNAGVTFSTALRSILRQDPDVLMIGEIRDRETAEIGVQAAMTGHLVIATLHTNNALAAVPRMLDLGVPGFLLAAVLDGVLAQRLVRRVCRSCSREVGLTAAEAQLVPRGMSAPSRVVRGSGCPSCRGSGYKGRTGIFELLSVGEHLRSSITRGEGVSPDSGNDAAGGMQTLLAAAWNNVIDGTTTPEEVVRVTAA
jgi:general secretion pathway protein E